MKKIHITIGLPASSKTTWAKEQVKKNPKTSMMICRDDLREMLFNDICLDKRESFITDAQDTLVLTGLTQNKEVYIHNTHLNNKDVEYWRAFAKQMNAELIIKDFRNTSIETCIERDGARSARVGRAVIEGMALKAGMIDFNSHEKWLILDVDGTAANISDRKHFVTDGNKDWNSFFKNVHLDTVNHHVIEQVNEYRDKGVGVIVLSGRPTDKCGKETEDWLNINGIEYEHLFMRKAKDNRGDEIIKAEILDLILNHIKIEDIVVAFDDRPRIVRLWESKGITVIDCGDGIEF